MELKLTDNLTPLSCSIDTLLQAWILHTPPSCLYECQSIPRAWKSKSAQKQLSSFSCCLAYEPANMQFYISILYIHIYIKKAQYNYIEPHSSICLAEFIPITYSAESTLKSHKFLNRKSLLLGTSTEKRKAEDMTFCVKTHRKRRKLRLIWSVKRCGQRRNPPLTSLCVL